MKLHFIFQYEALTYQNEFNTGKIVARSKSHVYTTLIQQQKTPIKITLHKIIFFQESDKQYRIHFFEQLTLLLQAGLALLASLILLKNECRYLHWQYVLDDIIYHLNQGSTFSKQLNRYPLYFPLSLTHFIYIGEESGKLDETIILKVNQLKKQQEIIKKIKKAFKYPIFLIIALFAITIMLLVYVLPEYQSLYHSFNKELPLITLLLISLSQWIIHHGVWISITLFLLFLTYLLIRITVLQLRVIEQRILFRLPYLGELLKYHYLQFIFQILTITQQAGLPLLKGLDIIIQQLPNPLYHHALCQLREHIIKGKSLSAFMKNESLFPPICYQFIISAENSGQLLFFCQQLSDWFRYQLEDNLNTISTWLEPILMAIIALIIGTLVIAMYLPVLYLGDTIQ